MSALTQVFLNTWHVLQDKSHYRPQNKLQQFFKNWKHIAYLPDLDTIKLEPEKLLKLYKCMEVKQLILNNQCVKGKNQEENFKTPWNNWKWKYNIQKPKGFYKSSIQKKFIAYIQKVERPPVDNLLAASQWTRKPGINR